MNPFVYPVVFLLLCLAGYQLLVVSPKTRKGKRATQRTIRSECISRASLALAIGFMSVGCAFKDGGFVSGILISLVAVVYVCIYSGHYLNRLVKISH